jgi:hypothetical protein
MAGERWTFLDWIPPPNVTYWVTLPPPEYEHKFIGRVVVTRAQWGGVRPECDNKSDLGCSRLLSSPLGPICSIYIADDATLKRFGWNYKWAYAHEVSHCGSWPADHRGALDANGNPIPYYARKNNLPDPAGHIDSAANRAK